MGKTMRRTPEEKIVKPVRKKYKMLKGGKCNGHK